MMSIKLISLFALVLCLMPNESSVSATFFLLKKSCLFPLRCSNSEATVYATDGTTCYLYRNGCQLKMENCQRLRNAKPQLISLTKTACQARCTDVCTTEYVPVCGEYRGVYKTYSNNCELLRVACVAGQSIRKTQNGECTQI